MLKHGTKGLESEEFEKKFELLENVKILKIFPNLDNFGKLKIWEINYL